MERQAGLQKCLSAPKLTGVEALTHTQGIKQCALVDITGSWVVIFEEYEVVAPWPVIEMWRRPQTFGIRIAGIAWFNIRRLIC